MKKLRLFRKVAAWAVCALLACSMAPAVALAGSGGGAGAGQGLVAGAGQEFAAASRPGKAEQAVAPKAGLKDYTWVQLKKISKKIASAKSDAKGLAIAKKYGLVNARGKLTGATKSLKLTDGTKAKVRILGFRQDKLASGGVSGISFEFADVPATHSMNGEWTNEGGWKGSGMRSWLNSGFYKMLPSDLKKQIAPAKKRTNNVGEVDYSDTGAVSATKDKLWLLSSTEVYGKIRADDSSWYKVCNAEGSQYKLYSDKKVTTSNYSFCEKTGANSWWWLRSPYASNSGYFHNVYSDGDWYSYGASNTYGVSPGFCF